MNKIKIIKQLLSLSFLLSGSLALSNCGNSGGTGTSPTEFCANGGAENNDWTNWRGWHGTFTNPRKHSGIQSNRHMIMNAGAFDPSVGGTLLPIVAPGGGQHSVRLGNTFGDSEGEQLRFYFTVSPNTRNFRFRYAVVMRDPGHPAADQPAFKYRIVRDGVFNSEITSSGWITADVNNPYFEISPNASSIIYRNWTCVSTDLSQYEGKKCFVEFTTRDCSQGAIEHFALAYIDMVCGSAEGSGANPILALGDSYCLGDPIVADGSASTGELNHYWSIERVTSTGQSAGMYFGGWQQGLAGTFDLVAYLHSKGQSFECGQYYRVKLALGNACSPWVETTKTILIQCPAGLDAGPDKTICSGMGSGVVIGSPGHAGSQYTWTPATGLSNPNVAQPIANPSSTITYTLLVTNPSGACRSGRDEVTVWVSSPPTATISAVRPNPCGMMELRANPNTSGNHSYQWSTGSPSQLITVNPNVTTSYTVTVTNACGSDVETVTVGPKPYQALSYSIPTAFTPNNDGLNDLFRVIDPSMAIGQNFAYGAIYYNFMVFNRLGNRVHHQTNSVGQNGFSNGEIAWDGKYNNVLQPRDTYLWTLEIRRCGETKSLRGEVTLVL